MKIRKDDVVIVITGDDKGTRAKVLRTIPDEGKIVVEGVNRVYKHLRPTSRNQQGGRLSKEMPIDASNVLLYCDRCARGVRVGFVFDDEGRKHRRCVKCQGDIGRPGPAKPRRAPRPTTA